MKQGTWHISGKGSARYAPLIRTTLLRACRAIQCKNVELSVIFIDDEKMRELNRTYRNKDRTTNVLAFETGDILISLEEARREAKKYSWTLRYEIVRLALHGFLHLLGYDHIKDKDTKIMESLEKKVLAHF